MIIILRRFLLERDVFIRRSFTEWQFGTRILSNPGNGEVGNNTWTQVMAFLESISKWGASTSGIIIANVVNWKQLNTYSRSVLCILQSETTWEKFLRGLILRFFLIPRRVLER
jgi:hypothetical protein